MSSAGDAPRKFRPTPEQVTALDNYRTGDSLVVEAGAGTGKTATLKMLAESDSARRGQYVAFNRGIVNEASEKFPRHVSCNTAHSLAFRVVGRQYGSRLRDSRRMRSRDIARHVGIDRGFEMGAKRMSPSLLASIASRAVTKFCQTADQEMTVRHVPFQIGLDEPGSYVNNNALSELLLPYARVIWEDAQSLDGVLPFKHEYYLKMWELSSPRIPADVIFFDEAQDASPVLVSIVAQQAGAQIVWVGDSNQQIYEFTGAVNALASIDVPHRSMLTQSFRFGQPVADVANSLLERLPTDMRMTGDPTIESVIGPVDQPDAVLTRTNALCVTEYLTYRLEGRKPHIVGGGDDVVRFARAADDLMTTGFTSHPELACFDSWGEVQAYVAEDAQGDELRLLVKLVDEFTPRRIVQELSDMVPERQSDLIISTAHKSKGLEWDAVALSSDFTIDAKTDDAEMRLLYVATTRARRALDTGDVLAGLD